MFRSGAVRVLVTGFGPFLDHRENPSATLARSLAGAVRGAVEMVVEAPLPVTFGLAAERVLAAADALGAEGIVALGLAARTPYVRVETRATNRASAGEPDATGAVRAGALAEPGGPEALSTPIDVAAFREILVRHGVAAEVSEDAGGYVCNDLYYRLLRAAHGGRAPARVLFVHLPENPHPRTGEALLAAVARTYAGPDT